MALDQLRNWLLPTGRIGLKGYWLHYLLPALLVLASPLLGIHAIQGVWETAGPVIGVATGWLLVVGNVKRLRDLRLPVLKAGGAWLVFIAVVGVLVIGALGAAFMFALPMLALGVLTAMSSGQSGYFQGLAIIDEALASMSAPVVLFILINAIPILILGVVPGVTFREAPSRDWGALFRSGLRLAGRAGAVLLVGIVGYAGWFFASNTQPRLIRAIAALDVSKVTALLEKGANPDELIIQTFRDDPPGGTALGFAASLDGSPEADSIVAALVRHGASPAGSPLYSASRQGRSEVLELMVDALAQASGGALDPVQLDASVVAAIEAGHPGVVRFLLDAGADHRKTFARAFLSRGQDTAIVRVFLEHGADPNGVYSFERATGWILPIDSTRLRERNRTWEGTPLMLALQYSPFGDGRPEWRADVIRLLIDSGADPTVRSPTCFRCAPTPLGWGESLAPGLVDGGDSVYREVMDLLTEASRD